MSRPAFALIVVAASLPMADLAQACEIHDKARLTQEEMFHKAEGPISFQLDRPVDPAEGHIWIDAKTGEQYVFQTDRWLARSSGFTLSQASSAALNRTSQSTD